MQPDALDETDFKHFYFAVSIHASQNTNKLIGRPVLHESTHPKAVLRSIKAISVSLLLLGFTEMRSRLGHSDIPSSYLIQHVALVSSRRLKTKVRQIFKSYKSGKPITVWNSFKISGRQKYFKAPCIYFGIRIRTALLSEGTLHFALSVASQTKSADSPKRRKLQSVLSPPVNICTAQAALWVPTMQLLSG